MTSVRRLRQRRRRWRWRGKINFSHTFICKLYTRTLYSVHTHVRHMRTYIYIYTCACEIHTSCSEPKLEHIVGRMFVRTANTYIIYALYNKTHFSRVFCICLSVCERMCVCMYVCCACRVHFSWSTRPLSAAYCALELLRVTGRTLRGPRAWHDLWKYVYLTFPNVWAEHTRSAHILSTSQDQLTCRQLCINQQHK